MIPFCYFPFISLAPSFDCTVRGGDQQAPYLLLHARFKGREVAKSGRVTYYNIHYRQRKDTRKVVVVVVVLPAGDEAKRCCSILDHNHNSVSKRHFIMCTCAML